MDEPKHRPSHAPQSPSSSVDVEFAPPCRRAAEFLCQEVLMELQALERNDAAELMSRGGEMPASWVARQDRRSDLVAAAKALADASAYGALDDPQRGADLLREHAARLGPRYLAMLPLLAEPAFGGSADGPESAEHLQLAVQIDTRMQQLLSAGKNRMEIMADMFDYMPAFKRLMDTLPRGGLNRLCRRFGGLGRYARLIEGLAEDIQAGRVQVPR